MVEVIRHLADTGAFVQDDDGRWVLSIDPENLDLPTSVREVVAHRVARLGEETEQALSLASVIGRDFDVEVLAELLGCDEDRLLDLLEGAIGAGLISESDDEAGSYQFVHALIQHTLYQDLGATRRQRCHQRVAEALEARSADSDDHVAELAQHYMAATRPTDVTKALHYARRAGDVALASYAPLDAARWYAQALELLTRQTLGGDRDRCALLVALGTAQCRAAQPEFRRTLLDAAAIAESLDDASLLVAAAVGSVQGDFRLAGADIERIGLLQAALAALGTTNDPLRARLLVGLAEATDAREWMQRRDLAVEAMTFARGLGDDATMVDVMTKGYGFRCEPESLSTRLAETEEAIALADRLNDVPARLQSRWNRRHACFEAGVIEEADRRLEEFQILLTQTGLPFWQWGEAVARCGHLTNLGDLVGAEAANEQALEIGTRTGNPHALANYGAMLLEIRAEQGRIGEVADLFIQAAADNPAMSSLRAVVVSMYIAMGRLEEARAVFDTDVADAFAQFPRDLTWTTVMAQCADAAVDLRYGRAAQLVYEQLGPFSDLVAFPMASVFGALTRPLGRLAHLLGHRQEAESHFRAALQIHERFGCPYLIARTKLDYADLLADRAEAGDEVEAKAMVGEALVAAETYGYGGLQPRARLLLDSLG